MFDEDFQAWIDIEDIEEILSMSELKIILAGKLKHDLKNNMFLGFTILVERWWLCFHSKIKVSEESISFNSSNDASILKVWNVFILLPT